MSGAMRSKKELTSDLIRKEMVSEAEKKAALESAIFEINRRQQFLGGVLQSLNIQYNHLLPTAGVMYNNQLKRWDMLINPYYFCKKVNKAEIRQGILLHEILHILHKHPLRVAFTAMPARKRQIMNVAMDMAINQHIEHLPDGCPQCPPPEKRMQEPCKNPDCCGRAIFLRDFFDTDEKGNKIPWEANKTAETYYEKLLQRLDEPEDGDQGDGEGDGEGGASNGQGQGQGNGEGEGEGQGEGEGEGKGNAGGGAQSSDIPDTQDVHAWDGSGEESDQLEATEDLIKRAMIKSNYSFDKLPGFIKDTLEYIDARKAELDYRRLIMLAMKASLPANSREYSWSRKSRRFGTKAPGTRNAKQPKLEFFIDTSGSISIEEANEFLGIMDEFLKVGATECRLNLFHTENYYSEEYHLGDRLDRSLIQSGGTCLEHSLKHIADRRPDLSVFLTDGCYGDVNVEEMVGVNDKFPRCLFIISRDAYGENHPLKRLGATIKIPST